MVQDEGRGNVYLSRESDALTILAILRQRVACDTKCKRTNDSPAYRYGLFLAGQFQRAPARHDEKNMPRSAPQKKDPGRRRGLLRSIKISDRRAPRNHRCTVT